MATDIPMFVLALAGLGVGFVVGLTGMGGGALMTPILVLIVVFGFFPGLIFDVTNPAVSLIARAVGGN